MSRGKEPANEKDLFIARFVEACGTSEASKIQRLLNISYQAAKNYLNGRLPDAHVLTTIAARTPYSIHWLLTGEGEKFPRPEGTQDTFILGRQIREIVRQECVDVVNEILESKTAAQPKVVVLQPDKLRSEKVHERSTVSDERSDYRAFRKHQP